ncbi:unnamed protein product [Adineta steineri]|uniref:Uncharacterized protein n=1 Tax=Adineta steineri TaxID=433720 RepID=A0A815NZ41_9BILA|nr:unnamed protein product [Adineta steineri]
MKRREPSWIPLVLILTTSCTILVCIICRTNDEHSAYRQSDTIVKKFTTETICRIDQIVLHREKYKQSSMIILNSTFLISFEVISNGNSRRVQAEHWAVPVPFKPDLINSTYRCFIDPLDTQQQPLTEIPDIASIRHDFIWYTLIPNLTFIVLLTIILLLVIILFLMYPPQRWFRRARQKQPETTKA